MTRWKALTYAVLLYIGLVIDGATGLRVNFLLLALIVFSIRETRSRAVIFGFLLGILLDCLSPRLFGLNALLFTSAGYVLGSVGERVYTNRIHLIAFIIVITSLCYLSIYFLLSSFRTFPSVFVPVIVPTALYNTAIGILLFYSTSRLCPRVL